MTEKQPISITKKTQIRLRFLRMSASALMVWEACVKSLWRSIFWSILFIALWLFEWPSLFGINGYYAANILYLAGLFYFLLTDIKAFARPVPVEVDRRIESDSGAAHRPLTSLHDKPVQRGEFAASALWQARQVRLSKDIEALKLPKYRSFLSHLDRYAVRLCIVLILCAGILVSGPDWRGRLSKGFVPYGWVERQTDIPDIIATITPPEYTNAAQTVLQITGHAETQNIEIIAGSRLKIQTRSHLGHPVLNNPNNGDEWEFQSLGHGNYALDMTIPDASQLVLTQFFRQRLLLNYTYIADTAPVIVLRDEPKILDNAQVQIPLTVRDDFGVEYLSMSMHLDPKAGDAPLGYPQDETRSIMSAPDQDFDVQPVYDFTANPWAGLPVVIKIQAADMINQRTDLKDIELILPERDFAHPISQKLIALRKRLAWQPVEDMIPVAHELETIMAYPQDFQDDPVVFLALRVAASRLGYAYHFKNDPKQAQKDDPYKETKSVMHLLWDTALRIEDGNLSLAERNLREAQMALEEALQRDDLSDAETSLLMDKLRQAMAEYLQELAKELQKQMAEDNNMPLLDPETLEQLISPEALGSFLEQMENEMLSGNTRNAQDMLSQLQRMLDMLNPNMAGPMPSDMQAMMDGVSELQQLIEKQETLLEQTETQAEKFGLLPKEKTFGKTLDLNMDLFEDWGLDDIPPAPSKPKTHVPDFANTLANKSEQEALRYILGQLMLDADQALEKIPPKMGLSEQEMRSSSDALGQNNPAQSIPHQELAIQYLREAQQDLSQQLDERMQEMMGENYSMNGQPQMGDRDPLGRRYRNSEDAGPRPFLPGSRVEIPDEAERKRAEEILRILRNKSGDFSRPKEELDYFRRLLKQF